ncbi:DUF3606 domain-containing protein [Ramlibacter sp. AN1015]|uniref:DUF3606 domain-containing protein n=1 Tax=Ramlibacter sp. AN1015 TaxID=3133428 RepID=UPI0030C1D09F
MKNDRPAVRESDRIDTSHDYAVCAWARHFNVSEKQVREAVAAVGDRAVAVARHLQPSRRTQAGGVSERPSGA